MEFECFIWIAHMWKELLSIFPPLKRGDVRPLPNEIIFEILSRLPADEVLKCLSVSKEWKALVPTPLFSQAHLTRACPIVFIQYRRSKSYFCSYGLDVFFLDQGAKKNRMIKKVYNKPTLNLQKIMPKLVFSYNGFIIFEEYKPVSPSSIFFIYNPITQEEITLEKPVRTSRDVCGMYFHLLTREYRLIYAYRNGNGNGWHYLILYQHTMKWRKLCTFSYAPTHKIAPVNMNGFIYWIVDSEGLNDRPACDASILTFNTQIEKLQVMPHPGNRCRKCQIEHAKMQLLQMESKLLFCRLYKKHIKVWELEDSTKWLWVERYNINLDWDLNRYPFSFYHQQDIKLLNIQDGELLLCWYHRGLFRYHLELKTLRKLDVKISGRDFTDIDLWTLYLTAYTKSLESWRKHV